MDNPKCEYCGKEYVKNGRSGHGMLTEALRLRVEYSPTCVCIAKIEAEKRLKEEQLEQKRIQNQQALEEKLAKENARKTIEKYQNMSITGKKFFKSTFENADLESYHMKVANRYAAVFDKLEERKGILFYGDTGVGKTFACACIANELMAKGKCVLVINLGLYIVQLKEEWGKLELEILEAVKNVDLLIIDDFGSEQSTDSSRSWKSEKIYNLIDCAYREETPVIISTNLRYNENPLNCEIQANFKDRVRSRIMEMCFPTKATGKDKRAFTKENFIKMLG